MEGGTSDSGNFRLRMRRLWVFLLVILPVLVAQSTTLARKALRSPAVPAGIQAWPKIDLIQVVSGLASPVDVTHAGDGSGRLFVVERGGRIKTVQGGAVTGIFLDIHERVRSPENNGSSEEGLLSLAFPPGFEAAIEHFYVYYTNLNGDNQLSRFSLGAGQNQADPASEEIILIFPHPVYTNHNGGQLAFGVDGFLYIGTGDGGSGGDPQGNAQNPGSLLGKLLRIDVDPARPDPASRLNYLPTVARNYPGGSVTPPLVRCYAIPGDNPFVKIPGYRAEIWALGLRNPWRFSFDRLSGDLWLGDVGQANWEEIDFQLAGSQGGENYGWNVLEGNSCYSDPNCSPASFTAPVWVYPHTNGNCSVTGGMVYRGTAQPALQGIYFYADYCSGVIWGLRQQSGIWENAQLLDTVENISSFGEDEGGELFLAGLNSGIIYRVIQTP